MRCARRNPSDARRRRDSRTDSDCRPRSPVLDRTTRSPNRIDRRRTVGNHRRRICTPGCARYGVADGDGGYRRRRPRSRSPARTPRQRHPGRLEGLWSVGYLKTLDWSWIAPIGCVGTGKVWARPKPELVEGEKMSALERLFAVADISNGSAPSSTRSTGRFSTQISRCISSVCPRESGSVSPPKPQRVRTASACVRACSTTSRVPWAVSPRLCRFAPFLISRNGRECA